MEAVSELWKERAGTDKQLGGQTALENQITPRIEETPFQWDNPQWNPSGKPHRQTPQYQHIQIQEHTLQQNNVSATQKQAKT